MLTLILRYVLKYSLLKCIDKHRIHECIEYLRLKKWWRLKPGFILYIFERIYSNLKPSMVLWQRYDSDSKVAWCMGGRYHRQYCAHIHIQVSHSIACDSVFQTYLRVSVFPNHQLHENKDIIGFAFIYWVCAALFLLRNHAFGKHVSNLPTLGVSHHCSSQDNLL